MGVLIEKRPGATNTEPLWPIRDADASYQREGI
jgi:hypothetical protein